MTAFADADELELYTQYETDGDLEDDQADQALLNATARIRRWTGQHIAPVSTGAVFERLRMFRARIVLPHPPAIPVTVTKVEVDGEELGSDDWFIDELHCLTRTDDQYWSGHVKVIYDHGFAEAPDDVKDVCLSVASRAIGNPEGVMQGKFGQQSLAWASEPGVALGLDRSHKDALQPFKLLGMSL